ncbi:MAG: anthranilate synthase component 1 [Buchananella hordeovulneris]|nr:anthranilate synthase component 1 [Buchananella hordeovulneris]
MAELQQTAPRVFEIPVEYQPDGGALLDHLAKCGFLGASGADTAGTEINTGGSAGNAAAASAGPVLPQAVLLESADVVSKAHLTTIAVLDSALTLSCDGDLVTATAQPDADGRAQLQHLCDELPHALRERCELAATFELPSLREEDADEGRRLSHRATMEPLRVLADAEVDHPHLPLLAGVVAFDYLATMEELPVVAAGANTCPDYLFYSARVILVVDHESQTANLVGASLDDVALQAKLRALAAAIDACPPAAGSTEPVENGAETLTASPTVSDADFVQTVRLLQENIAAGDVYQVVPSRGYQIQCPDPLAAYRHLRLTNPSPYMFYIGTPDFQLFGASPESSLLHCARTGRVSIRPIAGTRPRGFDPEGGIDTELDTRLELELRSDAKEVAEHVMLVDLARNDVARVAKAGTRRVDVLLRVDRYSRVMHLVSEVSGQLRADLHPLDAFRASMTMGTLTGAPKLEAAGLIRQAEGQRRGSYGGAVGYLRGDGELDTCIVIRSAFVRGGRALVQAGAGVVSASLPANEAAETRHKASAVLSSIAAAQGARLVIAAAPAACPDHGEGAGVTPGGAAANEDGTPTKRGN